MLSVLFLFVCDLFIDLMLCNFLKFFAIYFYIFGTYI